MKKLVTLVLILSLGLFCTIGCGGSTSGPKKGDTAADDGGAPPPSKGPTGDEGAPK